MVVGHQQHVRPHGPLVLRLGPGPSASLGGSVGSQQDGEVVRCGFLPPPPPLPSCSSSSSASLLLVAAPLPSQPISSRLVRGAAYSAYIHPSVACPCPPTPLFCPMISKGRGPTLALNCKVNRFGVHTETSGSCKNLVLIEILYFMQEEHLFSLTIR